MISSLKYLILDVLLIPFRSGEASFSTTQASTSSPSRASRSITREFQLQGVPVVKTHGLAPSMEIFPILYVLDNPHDRTSSKLTVEELQIILCTGSSRTRSS